MIMKKSAINFLWLSLLNVGFVYGHARLLSPVPRTNADGNKVGPCGATPSMNIYKAKPGQKLKISFEETIDHPGYYIFSFNTGATPFIPGDPDFNKNILVTNVPNPAGKQASNEVEVQLPNISCKGCTLQMIQVMTENPAAPRNYYSCADLDLDPSNEGVQTPLKPADVVPVASPVASPTQSNTPEDEVIHQHDEAQTSVSSSNY